MTTTTHPAVTRPENPKQVPIGALLTMIERQARRLDELERWKADMAESVVTNSVHCVQLSVKEPDDEGPSIYATGYGGFGSLVVSDGSDPEGAAVAIGAQVQGGGFVTIHGPREEVIADLGGLCRDGRQEPVTPTTHGIGAADGCGFDGSPGHDWVLGIEERGVAGIAELIARLGLTLDGEAGDDEEVPVWDLPDVCARHNWKDPAAVERVVSFIIDAYRCRRGSE